MQQLQSDKKAFVSLSAVIIVGLVATVVAVTSLQINSETSKKNKAIQDSLIAKSVAYSCSEIALNKVKTDLLYVGNETVTIGTYTCQIATITGSGNSNRTINVQTNVAGSVKKITVVVTTLRPTTVISSWKEIP